MNHAGVSLQEAIEHLYQTAVIRQARTSTIRLQKLAWYCVQQLESRGLPGAEAEETIPGGGRTKKWDVAWKQHAKYRLAISLKSILENLPGTVPNRIDDLMGEVANIQMYSPEMVVGYLMIFNVSQDTTSRGRGTTWSTYLKSRLMELSGRSAPSWSVGMIEAFTVLEVDFSKGAQIITPEVEVHNMFDTLILEVKKRNPSLG